MGVSSERISICTQWQWPVIELIINLLLLYSCKNQMLPDHLQFSIMQRRPHSSLVRLVCRAWPRQLDHGRASSRSRRVSPDWSNIAILFLLWIAIPDRTHQHALPANRLSYTRRRNRSYNSIMNIKQYSQVFGSRYRPRWPLICKPNRN